MVAAVTGGGFGIVVRLNTEWAGLQDRHSEVVRKWAGSHGALSACDTLADLLDAVRSDPDGALFGLLTEAARGNGLAARVVLQAMLGKIVRLASRDVNATADDYVAAMWCRIATYPLQERPATIAANLALDTLKAVRGESTAWVRRGLAVRVVRSELLVELEVQARDHALLDHNASVGALTADSLIDAASRLGLIDGLTRQVLLSVYAEGLSGRLAADRHQTSPEMVRYRCSRAVRRLAQHSAALADAA
ncbi:MAG TPA: hypothetical protein VF635_02125 [Propionibacteriaceae bacterium]